MKIKKKKNELIIPKGHFWREFFPHLLFLFALIPGVWALYRMHFFGQGSFLGIKEKNWFFLVLFTAVGHQLTVALVFRAQLCWNTVSKMFGKFDILVWAFVFMAFFAGRFLFLAGLSLADYGSLRLSAWIHIPAGIILILPAIYGIYTVKRYFGIERSLGGDHFREKYRRMPFVKKGAYRFTDNVMYSLIFLALWGIALLCNSGAALIIAAFQHAYIWVNFYCTEKPDMEIMYKKLKG